MNDMQTRLTELLNAGVGDPPARVTVQAVRRQRARRRAVAAVGAASAVAVIAVAGAALSGRWESEPGGQPECPCRTSALSYGMACRPWRRASG